MTSETCAELMEGELQALQSIYPDFMPVEQPHDSEPFSIQVSVQLSEPLQLHIMTEDYSETTPLTPPISHLPPLVINLLLPSTYPLYESPTIKSIQPSHGWLPSPLIEHLTQILLEKWKNNCVLGEWIEHIQHGDQLLSSLKLLHHDPKSIRIPNASPRLLSSLLIAYNKSTLDNCFQEATHTCPICISRVFGVQCISLSPCTHVACRSCLREFWGGCIAEGDVTRVGCPDPECVKESRGASIDDVKAVLTQEQVQRWQRLLTKREIERDPTIIHCPLTFCQKAVKGPASVHDGRSSGWDRLRTCECGFSFCMYCRRVWHGPHTTCAVLGTADFVLSYIQHPPGSPEREAIELRYGRSNVLKAVAQYNEEQANRQWFDKETMACPGCHVRVQKNMGCNHMKCTKCQQHFCYRCGAKVEATNPYRHFNTLGHPCYSKLFDTHSQVEDQWIVIEDLEQ